MKIKCPVSELLESSCMVTYLTRVLVQFLPTFGTTWFIHERRVFMVRRVSKFVKSNQTPDEYASAPVGNEPLVVMCLGRSVKPIKRFLTTCRDYAEEKRASFTTVRASFWVVSLIIYSSLALELTLRPQTPHKSPWDTTVLRPIRALETVHFDEQEKASLVTDITNYLEPSTRDFYNSRGIPYRRGYLLHGTP